MRLRAKAWRRRREPRDDADGDLLRLPVLDDPLRAIRVQLVNATHRLNMEERREQELARRRELERRKHLRRLRRVATVAATALFAVGAAAGASELGADVPLVESVLDSLVAGQRGDDGPSDGATDPTLPRLPADVSPGPGNVSDPIPIPRGDGPTGAAAAYLNSTGLICVVIAWPDRTGGVAGCSQPAALTARLADEQAFVAQVTLGDVTLVTGYAAVDVEEVEVAAPDGRPLDVRLGDPWTPQSAGGQPFRVLLAIAPAPQRSPTMREDLGRFGDPGAYTVKPRTGSAGES